MFSIVKGAVLLLSCPSWSHQRLIGFGTKLRMTSSMMAAAADSPELHEQSRAEGTPLTDFNKPLHFVILVHGYMGNDLELGYLESTLRSQAADNSVDHQFVVYSAKDNVGRTHDGVAAGGTRLADEITRQIQSYVSTAKNIGARQEPPVVTLSFVGNSLGGLYARYALAKLDLDCVQPLVFCTTATPHLGVSKNTYIPLPRAGEWLVSSVMQPTGRDLFGFTDIVRNLALKSEFMGPLQVFRKRIAYANAFGTDFQVPTATAAFLSKSSEYPHHVIHTIKDTSPFALTVETRPDASTCRSMADPDPDLSQALDSLGWTKVFCDTRDNIPLPSIPIPFSSIQDASIIHSKPEWTSQELYNTMTGVQSRWHVPLGHTVMVANSKNDWYSRINERGRPLMDQLAIDMIRDILEYASDYSKGRDESSSSLASSK